MYVQVSIIKDKNGFYPDGCVKSVNCKSTIGPVQSIVTEESQSTCVDFGELGSLAKYGAVGTTNALKIIDPIYGEMWITTVGATEDAATRVSFAAACACCTPGVIPTGAPAVPIEFVVGSPEADDLGVQDGDTVITNAGFVGHNVLLFRDFGLDGSIDPGTGDAWHTPKLLSENHITVSTPVQDGEHILILIL